MVGQSQTTSVYFPVPTMRKQKITFLKKSEIHFNFEQDLGRDIPTGAKNHKLMLNQLLHSC